MQELETQVASCGTLSESENICTYVMDLHSVNTILAQLHISLIMVSLMQSLLVSVFAGTYGQPIAVQIRFVLVPGGCCHTKCEKNVSCKRSGLFENFTIWVIFEGDSW